MCGRFASARSDQSVARLFWFTLPGGPEQPGGPERPGGPEQPGGPERPGAEQLGTALLPPSWNIAPTQPARTVRTSVRAPESEGAAPGNVVSGAPGFPRELRVMTWGFSTPWKKRQPIINARIETVAEKRIFREAFAARRLIVPMDGYYEWQTENGKKQPYYLTSPTGEVLAAAGLYQNGLYQNDQFTIITTSAPDSLGHIHNRSPLLLPPDSWATWLDPDLADLTELAAFTAGLPQLPLTPIKVGKAVGNVRNNGPDLIKPITDTAPAALFG